MPPTGSFCKTHSVNSMSNSSKMFAENHSLWKDIWIPPQSSCMLVMLILRGKEQRPCRVGNLGTRKALRCTTRPAGLRSRPGDGLWNQILIPMPAVPECHRQFHTTPSKLQTRVLLSD